VKQIIVDRGPEVLFIDTEPGTVLVGTMKRM
jgi:hypothetical protein